VAGSGCDGDAPGAACADWLFSDPVIDVATLLFVPADAPVRFKAEADISGLRLCRPQGYGTGGLQRLVWRVDLRASVAADTVGCVDRLLAGRVHALAVNEFHAVAKLFELGLTEKSCRCRSPRGSTACSWQRPRLTGAPLRTSPA
jgi:polar amino acid transport system substrate-binding protein